MVVEALTSALTPAQVAAAGVADTVDSAEIEADLVFHFGAAGLVTTSVSDTKIEA